jgi:hypothetical protein
MEWNHRLIDETRVDVPYVAIQPAWEEAQDWYSESPLPRNMSSRMRKGWSLISGRLSSLTRGSNLNIEGIRKTDATASRTASCAVGEFLGSIRARASVYG